MEKLYKLVSGDLIKPSLADAMNVKDTQEFKEVENTTLLHLGTHPDTNEELNMNITVTEFKDIMVLSLGVWNSCGILMKLSLQDYVCFDKYQPKCYVNLRRIEQLFDKFTKNINNTVDGASTDLLGFDQVVKNLTGISYDDPDIKTKLQCWKTKPDRVDVYDMINDTIIRWVPR